MTDQTMQSDITLNAIIPRFIKVTQQGVDIADKKGNKTGGRTPDVPVVLNISTVVVMAQRPDGSTFISLMNGQSLVTTEKATDLFPEFFPRTNTLTQVPVMPKELKDVPKGK